MYTLIQSYPSFLHVIQIDKDFQTRGPIWEKAVQGHK